MITIFLNVNIQYLLHFQIDLFLMYFVVTVVMVPLTQKKQNKNVKDQSTGTDEGDNTSVM